MTDELADTVAAAPEPKPMARGWPKGKPRGRQKVKPRAQRAAPSEEQVKAAADRAEKPSMLAKMKSRPNWESDDYVGVGQDGVDRLKIPKEMIEALHRDGVALQWVTRSVRGQEAPQELAKMTRGGWTPVHQSDFDGLLDGMFMSKGEDDVITVDDCMLVARPAEIQAKARIAERRDARLPLQIAEEAIGHGIAGVTGSTAPGVRNSIKKSFERIEIPE